MKTILTTITFLTGAFLFSSCNPRLYFPDRAAPTLFTEKNQFLASASLKPQNKVQANNGKDSFQSKGASYSFDAAYALTNHWAVTGYYSNVLDRGTTESIWNSSGNLYNGNRGEIGATYFNPLPKNTLIELGAAIGQGQINRVGVFNNFGNFKTNFRTYSVQMAYSYKTDNFSATIGSKLWLQHYYKFASDSAIVRAYFLSNGVPAKDITQYPFMFASAFLNLEYGYKFIKLSTQIGTPFQFSGPRISSSPIYMTLGLVFRFEKDYFKPVGKSSTLKQ